MEQDKTLELLEEMKRINQKTLMHQRMATILLIIFVIAVVSMLPSVVSTLNTAKVTLEHMNDAVTEVETAIASVQTLTEEGSTGITAAIEKINELDIETLNDAITDLSEVVKPMADFFGRFK